MSLAVFYIVGLVFLSTMTQVHAASMKRADEREYGKMPDGVMVKEFTLHNGERVYTLAESAVFESPAAKHSLAAIQAAVLAAKVKSTAADRPAALVVEL